MKPSSGSMVYWRFKGGNAYRFGYVTYTDNPNIIRLGNWNGDSMGGVLADYAEIEWSPYNS